MTKVLVQAGSNCKTSKYLENGQVNRLNDALCFNYEGFLLLCAKMRPVSQVFREL